MRIFHFFLVAFLLLAACQEEPSEQAPEPETPPHEAGVSLRSVQIEALDIEVGELLERNVSGVIEANGELTVPPQNRATVTAVVGANVAEIRTIEGKEVRKGEVLAYLSHPELIKLQSQYLEALNRKTLLEQETERQRKLYAGEVGAGKTLQRTESELRSIQIQLKSLAAQLRQLDIVPEQLAKGEFYERVPVRSPVSGKVTFVGIETGQFVAAETTLFRVVNTHHIHAHLMVFEKDVHRLAVGQQVRLRSPSLPEQEILSDVYLIGKEFEASPRALPIHVEIENPNGRLLPGTYIEAEILTDSLTTQVLPSDAITQQGTQKMIFRAETSEAGMQFTPVRVTTGEESKGYIVVELLDEVPQNSRFALSGAYYLLAEMQKGEAGHGH